ncbi:hypothetical protein [Bradyrhizobium sp. SZCCHNR1002]|nr:hypothetical protein [Bradyrhizobium sp. SZCCHNR1002]
MAFISDPENRRRVFDPESGFELTGIFRDVPKDEFWFDFSSEHIAFMAKSKLSWSADRMQCMFTFNVAQLYHSYRCNPLRKLGRETMSASDFCATILQKLHEAVVAFVTRASGDPRIIGERLKAEVEFVDHAPDDSGRRMA